MGVTTSLATYPVHSAGTGIVAPLYFLIEWHALAFLGASLHFLPLSPSSEDILLCISGARISLDALFVHPIGQREVKAKKDTDLSEHQFKFSLKPFLC